MVPDFFNGLLGTFEHDVVKLREYVDSLDAVLNPNLERVRPKPKVP